ncbi:hypothetical protein J4448_07615 [Candidatus Woesearchaeota archaeon]|nr:hypothetical protein [Candidatus Woesearchaeota archaeon]
MKLKTLGRIGGVAQTSGAGFLGYLDYKLLSGTDYGKFIEALLGDYQVIEALLGDYPIEYKAAGVAFLALDGLTAASAVPLAVMAADGLGDIYKGTHHYLGMQIWKRITRNPQTREWVQKGIDDMIVAMERPIKVQKSV